MADLQTLARQLRAVQRGLPNAAYAANKRTGAGALQTARWFSSGMFKQAVFDTPVSQGGLGAPYGHGPTGWLGPRGDVPYGDLGTINAQTGVFRASWRVQSRWAFGGGAVWIENVASYAGFLETGTRLMKARPIGAHIEEYIGRAGPVHMGQEIVALWQRQVREQ